jgi:ring-1,2-phenylacetyl-CoA epoxidase subunit PaaC
MQSSLIQYILQLADNSFIHGHRLGEWCGHAPELEIDMALTNMALDHIGTARSLYQYAAALEGNGKTEDSYPYHRDARSFKNVLLLELPKGDFAETITRSLFFDAFQYLFYQALTQSSDTQLAAIAEKTLKEVTYHRRFSSEWSIRLGDGTAESKQRMQHAINRYWDYVGEMFDASAVEQELQQQGIAPDVAALKSAWDQDITKTLEEGGLSFPLRADGAWFQKGGKTGVHTEHIGFILAEVQHMQKSYPGCEW